MEYVTQPWADNVTPADAAHMTHIEQGIAAAVPNDSVRSAATRIVSNLLLGSDAQPAFKIMGDGKHQWGPGAAAAVDTNLYRSAAGELTTDGAFVAKGWNASGTLVLPNGDVVGRTATFTKLAADTQPRFIVGYDGKHSWGPGGVTAVDTTLYRAAAAILATDGALSTWHGTASQTKIGNVGPATQAGIVFGSAADANLYRNAAGVLQTDGQIIVAKSYPSGGVAKVTVGNFASGPPGSPNSGDIWIATNVTGTIAESWQFVYDTSEAGSFKWKFVGGPPVTVFIATSEATTSGVMTDLATVGPSYTIVRAGDYKVDFGATTASNTTSNGGNAQIQMFKNAGAVGWSPYAWMGMAITGAGYTLMGSELVTSTAVSDVLKLRYLISNGSSTNFGNRWITITPVRIS